ncbi:hypothetical protein [Bordetella trematum]|uniref:hypothetical protein n=1 Tax=Bordetella trematum TaxID=123899 RepID=UPI003AF3AE22
MKKRIEIALFGIVAAFFSIPSLAKDLPIKIKKEMEYSEARASLLKSGWQPVVAHMAANGTPICYEVVDLDPQDDRYADLVDSEACKYEEIEACSGSGMGFCSMKFFDGRKNYLSVITAGGSPPDAFVRSWSLSDKRGDEAEPEQPPQGQATLEGCKDVLLAGMYTGVLEDVCGFSGGVKGKLLKTYSDSGCRSIVPQEFVDSAVEQTLKSSRETYKKIGEAGFCREGAKYYNGFK